MKCFQRKALKTAILIKYCLLPPNCVINNSWSIQDPKELGWSKYLQNVFCGITYTPENQHGNVKITHLQRKIIWTKPTFQTVVFKIQKCGLSRVYHSPRLAGGGSRKARHHRDGESPSSWWLSFNPFEKKSHQIGIISQIFEMNIKKVSWNHLVIYQLMLSRSGHGVGWRCAMYNTKHDYCRVPNVLRCDSWLHPIVDLSCIFILWQGCLCFERVQKVRSIHNDFGCSLSR